MSEEVMKWLDKLTKGESEIVDHYRITPDVHWPITPLKQNSILQFTLDPIDDKADAFFNRNYLDSDDQNKPISTAQ